MSEPQTVQGERIQTFEPVVPLRTSRLSLVPFNKIVPSLDRPYLVKGLIPSVGITLVYGKYKFLKSFWVYDAMMHVALGRDYRGRKVRTGAVVYCAFEGTFGFGNRVAAFRSRFLQDSPDDVPFYLMGSRLILAKDRDELIREIRAGTDKPPVAVVLDTLNRSFSGAESSDADMTAYVEAADAIREAFDCAVIVVHHCGLDEKRPRGHTALSGAIDAQLAVKRDGDFVTVRVELMKDGPEGDIIVSRLESVEIGCDSDGVPVTSCVMVPGANDNMPAAPKGRELPDAAKTSLSALQQAIEERGVYAPEELNLPEGTQVVTIAEWRHYAYAQGISESSHDRAKQAAFKRAKDTLIERHKVGVSGEKEADRAWILP